MLGMSLVLSIIIVLLTLCGIIYRNILLLTFGVMFLVLLFAIRYRLKVVVDEKQIVYTGFFTTKAILFSDIVHSGWMFEHGYSRDRFYGSLVYEILSNKACIRINFRLFPLDLMNNVIEMIESLPHKSFRDNKSNS
jgi:hypothetical protein